MKTTQAIRNIRKFKKHQTSGVKGRMITDDYGNRYSVTNDPKATVARRHTLSRGKKRAIALGGDSVSEGLMRHTNAIKKHAIYRKGEKGIPKFVVEARHARSAVRRDHAADAFTLRPTTVNKNNLKSNYHTNRATLKSGTHRKMATEYAKQLHTGTKRKPKDFTK